MSFLVVPKDTPITNDVLAKARAGQLRQVPVSAFGGAMLLTFEAGTLVVLVGELGRGAMHALCRTNRVRRL